ncbi:hypothetical protein EDB92DRAFT_1862702 [Lactarius akahatsu]|uniref:Uncharacterized protein n=1 Tax=Lactarius akahatsu TaxID=416441 RepID=A0AAD4QDE6_9AGAM|nr:hypothetical protein EDB92DRAFT_1862702 [Lactarius akahatsu]
MVEPVWRCKYAAGYLLYVYLSYLAVPSQRGLRRVLPTLLTVTPSFSTSFVFFK